MLRSAIHNTNKYFQRAGLLIAAGLFVASSLVAIFAPAVSAKEIVGSSVKAATSYSWTDRQTISVSGGSVKSGQGLKVDANLDQPSTGSGIVYMTETLTIRDCPFLGLFCSDSDVANECYVSMSIKLSNKLF